MIAVAQKTSGNPVANISNSLNIGFISFVSHLGIPSKIMIPSFDGRVMNMLGLGDIAIPGLLLSFLYRLPLSRSFLYYRYFFFYEFTFTYFL